jgi:large subunit ribosomal protein L4
MVESLNAINAAKSLVVLNEKNLNTQASARNIEGVKAITVNTINVYDLLRFEKLVLEVAAVKTLEEVYA